MNTRKGKAKFNNFRIILDSGCSSTIVMWRLVKKICSKNDSMMQWHTQAGNITTNLNFEVEFNLPALRAKMS